MNLINFIYLTKHDPIEAKLKIYSIGQSTKG